MDKTADLIRLNKFLAERLGISRRQADDLIVAGKITWKHAGSDWQVAQLGDRIDASCEVRHKGVPVPFAATYQYYAMNKPVGYVCSRRAQGRAPTIYDLLPSKLRTLKTVGRLDKDSSGLVLLTNDGDFAYQMTHPKFVKEKVYLVELDRDLAPLHQQEIADFGVEIGDGVSRLGLTRLTQAEFWHDYHDGAPETAETGSPDERRFFRVTMSEGRNRQIRRTFAALGYEVMRLHRVQFGKYCLSGLKSGELVAVPKITQ